MAVKRDKRRDKDRIVLKKGETYREKENRYDYRWTDRDGKRHTVYASTLEELREKEAQIVKDVNDGIKAEARNVTVNDVYATWKDVKRGLRDHTYQNYLYMYDTFVAPAFGKCKISQLKKSDIRRFYNLLFEERVLEPSTIDNIHTLLQQVLNLALEDGYIRSNPSDNALKELKQAQEFRTEKRRALTQDEEKLLLDFLKRSKTYNHWYPIIAVMLGTGMRVGEVTGLRWCDIDLDEGMIDVNHTLVYYAHRIVKPGEKEGCYYAINSTKTVAGKRQIPMLDYVKEAFIQEKEYQEEAGICCNALVDGYTDFIFVNRFGGVQHQGTINKAIRRIIRDCNYEVLEKHKGRKEPVLLPHFSCHSLRHTFATRLCEMDVNIKVIQDTLGHSDISTTMDIYTDVTKVFKINTFKKLNKPAKTADAS